MIEAYFTDEVIVVIRSVDEWNQATEIEVDASARVNKTDKLVKSADGEDKQATYLIFLSSTETVSIGDRIRVKKIRGSDTGDTRDFPIINITPSGGFEATHIEVTV